MTGSCLKQLYGLRRQEVTALSFCVRDSVEPAERFDAIGAETLKASAQITGTYSSMKHNDLAG